MPGCHLSLAFLQSLFWAKLFSDLCSSNLYSSLLKQYGFRPGQVRSMATAHFYSHGLKTRSSTILFKYCLSLTGGLHRTSGDSLASRMQIRNLSWCDLFSVYPRPITHIYILKTKWRFEVLILRIINTSPMLAEYQGIS